jgi:FixJ family two-component response regulator
MFYQIRLSFMPEAPPTVIIVEDDADLRTAVDALLRSVGLRTNLYASALDFLKSARPAGPACLVLDVRLPGLGGLDLQAELAKSGAAFPIVFITGHGDIPMSVRAMKGGAIEFLTKPFRDQDLLDAVQVGLEQDRVRRRQDASTAQLRASYESLSPRERQIMALVVTGRLNKQIAATIGIAEITVKVHRSSIMRKMQAPSFADLVLMAEKLNLSPQAHQA